MPDPKQAELVVLESTSEQKQIIETRNAYDLEPADFKAGIKRRFSNRKHFLTQIGKALVSGTDFGLIEVKGTMRPCLFKPGAEKIAGLLGVRSRWPTLDEQIDRVQGGANCVILKCQLLDREDRIVSEGVGARLLSTDGGDINKAFKMAKKSSLIDAVLNCGGLSELYSQDLEDLPPSELQGAAAGAYSTSPSDWGGDKEKGKAIDMATHCTIGRHKGDPWGKVPDDYLTWIVQHILDNKALTTRAQKELDDRSIESQEATDKRRDDSLTEDKGVQRIELPAVKRQKLLDTFAKAIANSKTLDHIAMIREDMPADLKPVFRAYLEKRELELGG